MNATARLFPSGMFPANTVPHGLLALAIAAALLGAACKPRTPAEDTTPTPGTDTPPAQPETPTHKLRPASGEVEATDANVQAALDELGAGARHAREQWRGKTFEEFEATVFKEPGPNGKYIVNGDLAIPDRKQLQEFFEALQHADDETAHGKLTVRALAAANTLTGGVDIWSSARKKQLTYCVSNGVAARKAEGVAAMDAATRAWEDAANVDFSHVAAQDANCTDNNAAVAFDVRPVDVDGAYFARAFFPSEARADRNVLIDNSSFQIDGDSLQGLTLTGILRHELGHALGLRHEHTRPEAGTCFEDSNFTPVTQYDKFSVMHYPYCNGGSQWTLALTALDKAGAACLYGKGTANGEDLAQCVFRAPDAPAGGTRTTQVFDDQRVAKDEKKQYGPFNVKPGSIAKITMTGIGADAGDPDLYVRFLGPPDTSRHDCRPYTSHANETCEVELRAGRNAVFVMVRGYAAGHYKLQVDTVKPD